MLVIQGDSSGEALRICMYQQARAEAADLEALATDESEETALQQLAHEEGQALRARVCPDSIFKCA